MARKPRKQKFQGKAEQNQHNRYRLSEDEEELILRHRAKQVSLENINENDALKDYCQERGINMKHIVSVKHWQNMGGEPRFSIVTKDNDNIENTIFENITAFVAEHSPTYEKIRYDFAPRLKSSYSNFTSSRGAIAGNGLTFST